MGTCYYLIRRDSRTVYALGKASLLRLVFGEDPFRVTMGEVDTMVALILAAQRGDLDSDLDVTLHRHPDDKDEMYTYWRTRAIDIVDWSEGHPIELHSEDSYLYEELAIERSNHHAQFTRIFCTGGLGRDDLATRRRRSDDAFRSGTLWIDSQSGRKIANPAKALKVRAIAPEERSRVCDHPSGYTYTGLIPCTGVRRCHLCGSPQPE